MLVRVLWSLFSKKQKVNLLAAILIISTYPIGLIWHSYDTPEYKLQQWDWFYAIQFSDEPAWIVKWCLDEFCNLIIATSILIITWDNKFYRCLFIEYTLYRLLEVLSWFYNFKTVHYNLIYCITFGIGIYIWYSTFKTKTKT